MSEEEVKLRKRHSTLNVRSNVDRHHVEEARRENPEEIIDRKDFLLKSAITSIWLPCVVGDKPFIFLVSAIVSLLNKILLFIVAVLFKHYNVIETTPFSFGAFQKKMDVEETIQSTRRTSQSAEVSPPALMSR